MRHHIEHLSSNAMDWTQLSPGVSCKWLNHNTETGDRTALFRFVPEEGASAPNACHYHSVYEELFVLEGRMTFDHKTWLGEMGYVYHPPFAVHGFNSAVPEATTFIGRAPADLDFNYPDAPDASEPFFIDGKTASRDVTYLNPPDQSRWTEMLGPQGETIGRRFVLSQDRDTGEGSSLIRFDPGFEVRARPNGYDTYNEGFVLSGRVVADDGTQWTSGDYWHRHSGKPVPALTIAESTLVFSSAGRV